jgi:hypothetical protein
MIRLFGRGSAFKNVNKLICGTHQLLSDTRFCAPLGYPEQAHYQSLHGLTVHGHAPLGLQNLSSNYISNGRMTLG